MWGEDVVLQKAIMASLSQTRAVPGPSGYASNSMGPSIVGGGHSYGRGYSGDGYGDGGGYGGGAQYDGYGGGAQYDGYGGGQSRYSSGSLLLPTHNSLFLI